MSLNLNKIEFVYMDVKYLEYLHNLDSIVQFNPEDPNYDKKPHVGFLIENNGMKYVIQLTSPKPFHESWGDVTNEWYRIYEVINILETQVKPTDLIVDIKNQELFEDICNDEKCNYKQRILSILDIRRMIPVKDGVYTKVDFTIGNNFSHSDNKRIMLMKKEYDFLNKRKIMDGIIKRANKLYDKQMRRGHPLPRQCNYQVLEQACAEYKI